MKQMWKYYRFLMQVMGYIVQVFIVLFFPPFFFLYAKKFS